MDKVQLNEDMAWRWGGKLATWVIFVLLAWLCVGGKTVNAIFLIGCGAAFVGAIVGASYALAHLKLWWALRACGPAARVARAARLRSPEPRRRAVRVV